ncbi:MAG TPA: amylo-alpha-1,6-glucosidase [Vicinamibacterales bacterium]|jgi:predicted glycogen debranching enzyme|nr:amylo-alpha-1,6-glucosidase [Vicinamibacterales bacterium]
MAEVTRRLAWPSVVGADPDAGITREWLVTNGIGGYASGTVSGIVTRRYHGALIAALPAPLGRVVMVNHLFERARPARGRTQMLGEAHHPPATARRPAAVLSEFRLELGLPVWRFDLDEGVAIEKRLMMPYGHNTVHVRYSIVAGTEPVQLFIQPAIHFRPHEASVSQALSGDFVLTALDRGRYEVTNGTDWPTLRLVAHGRRRAFVLAMRTLPEVLYPTEESRGYEARGALWSPGYFRAVLTPARAFVLTASVDDWDRIRALPPSRAIAAERERRRRLLETAPEPAREGPAAELVLAADQFTITPVGRLEEAARARAEGDDVRTVIAGYHWFTDWGRDTMISLEGLTMVTGRLREAGCVLRTFAHHVRDGLIPNMFPEGDNEGLYHTADASLWFFQAVARYLDATGDRFTLRRLLPALIAIVDSHIASTRFGIGVDPGDGLLRQGAEGYQLTWMDAKVDGWVVTPRRGKAVEINALWYNALRLLDAWTREASIPTTHDLRALAARTRESFNRRFWYEQGNYLYDVVDAESGGSDAACRPNQILSISLTHPVLDPSKWATVVGVVRDRLLTPVGLRTLAPGHPDYKPRYYGDLRTRDAAYHQGTVWPWLIGPFIDAWLKTYPKAVPEARRMLEGLLAHLDDGCVGSVSEIFDAEPPFTPRGCIAQAWSVAELLRCLVRTGPDPTDGLVAREMRSSSGRN